ncbi:MAG: hypothetical protein ACYC35_20565 [Pirellulales bacterium]
MDGRTSLLAASRTPVAGTSLRLTRGLVLALVGLFSLAAVLVLARRLTRALETPLGTSAIITAGLVAAAVAAGIRMLWRGLPALDQTPWFETCVTWLPATAIACLGVAIWLPETPAGGLAAFWLIAGAEELCTWRAFRARMPADKPEAASRRGSMPPDEAIAQQLVRRRAADGVEVVEGWLRVAFEANQRTANVHVAFCPAFLQTPEVRVRQVDGPEARIKEGQVLPYGARLDLKLDEPSAEPATVLVEFSARSG